MTALAVSSAPALPLSDGVMRSAALLRALGARASGVWSTLTPHEAQQLTAAMQALPDDTALESRASAAYVRDMARVSQPIGERDPASTWSRLSALDGAAIAALLRDESPQVIAVILAQLDPPAAASAVRGLPAAQATEVLRRLLHLGPVRPAALTAIETTLTAQLSTPASAVRSTGHERVAAIFDRLDSRAEQGLLSALDQAEPGSAERVRALMFGFDDLATLDPASLQTILAGSDRAVLIVALKGAKPETAKAFLDNMTARAGDLLRSEIDAAGPVRRSEIEAARNEITALARTLVKRGEILSHEDDDDELVE